MRFVHFPESWTSAQQWTFVRLVAVHLAAYNALERTRGLEPFGVDVSDDDAEDEISREMVSAARIPRQPPEPYPAIPEPVLTLLADGMVPR